MSTAVQHRRGTSVQHASFAGAIGEITVDTTKKTAVVHDGATLGGMPLATEQSLSLKADASDLEGAAFLDEVNAFTKTQNWAKGADVASASMLTLGDDGNYFDITGANPITSIATKGVGTVVKLHFDAALPLTHNATDLVLPGGANITTAAGDEAEFVEYATGDWRCTNYQRAGSGYKEATVTSGSPAPLTSAAVSNLQSLSLEAGEWDVGLWIGFLPSLATLQQLQCSISSVSATLDNNPGKLMTVQFPNTPLSSGSYSLELAPKRIILSGTTTIFGVGRAVFSAGTISMFGIIYARRVK